MLKAFRALDGVHQRGLLKAYLPWVLVGSVVAVSYAPFLLYGGFTMDDWSVAYQSVRYPGFWDNYVHWFPLFSNRPLSPVILSIAGSAFGTNAMLYRWTQLCLWVCGVGILTAALGRFLQRPLRPVLLLLFALPAIASTVIFSVGMQLQCSVALILTAGGMLKLFNDVDRGRRTIWPFVLLLASLLVYEMFVPLAVFYMMYPWLSPGRATGGQAARLSLRSWSDWARDYLAPIFVVLGLVALLQKVIMPSFMVVYSRIAPGSIHALLHLAGAWVNQALFGTSALLVSAPHYAWLRTHLGSIACLVLAGSLAAVVMRPSSQVENDHRMKAQYSRRLPILTAVIALLGCSLLGIVSGYVGAVSGYDNRMFTSTWICGVFLFLLVVSKMPKMFLSVLVFALVILSSTSMLAQSHDQVRASRQQQLIVTEVLRLAHERGLPSESCIVASIPWRLADDYNGAVVFGAPWDLTAALAIGSEGRIVGSVPLNPSTLAETPRIEDGQVVFGEGPSGASLPLDRTWSFRLDSEGGSGSLVRASEPELVEQFAEVKGHIGVEDYRYWGLGMIQSSLGHVVREYEWAKRCAWALTRGYGLEGSLRYAETGERKEDQ